MHELIIAPKIYRMVSESAKSFIETETAPAVKKAVQKPYEYVGDGSRILNGNVPPAFKSSHPYFCPDTIINNADEDVAKHIRILG